MTKTLGLSKEEKLEIAEEIKYLSDRGLDAVYTFANDFLLSAQKAEENGQKTCVWAHEQEDTLDPQSLARAVEAAFLANEYSYGRRAERELYGAVIAAELK